MFRPNKKKESRRDSVGGGTSPSKSMRDMPSSSDRKRDDEIMNRQRPKTTGTTSIGRPTSGSGIMESTHQQQQQRQQLGRVSSANASSRNNNSTIKAFNSIPETSTSKNTTGPLISTAEDEKGLKLSMKQQIKASKLRRAALSQNYESRENLKRLKKYYIRDPSDPTAVGDLVSMITPIRPPVVDAKTATHKRRDRQPSSPLVNECLLALRVKSFEFSGNALVESHSSTTGDLAYGSLRKNINHMNPKSKNKYRYICITRSTNANLMKRRKGKVHVNGDDADDDDSDAENDNESSSDDEDNDNDSSDGYDTLYNPDDNDSAGRKHQLQRKKSSSASVISKATKSKPSYVKDSDAAVEAVENSSFPNLVCLAIQSDGTHPELRKILPLDQLVAIENVANKQSVQLVFQNGVVAEIDFEVKLPSGPLGSGEDNALKKERFLWSLLQIHAILCTAVMERNRSRGDGSTSIPGAAGYIASSKLASTSAIPTLTMRNVDRAELQYISTVNGFLSESPVLCALLERQRLTNAVDKGKSINNSGNGAGGYASHDPMSSFEQNNGTTDEMDGIAYDMIMGNFSHLTLFLTEEEKQDAEEVLNSTVWQDGKTDSGDGGKIKMDEISTAETLTGMLQKRMRDLEAETCRRLIAWEDEKYYNSTGKVSMRNRRDTMEALSLSVLFKTLDDLDEALEGMEDWLSDKAAAIKPLTDDCREVEEENRQLAYQRKSYSLISDELKRLMSGLEVPDDVEAILKNPRSKMVHHPNGNIDIVKSQDGVEDIYLAGRALKESFDKVKDEGGVNLRGVKDRLEGLLSLSNSFCDIVTNTIIVVMERTTAEIGGNDDFDYLSSPHGPIGKSIRNTQRKFQSSLLAYVQLNEVLALLKPSKLPMIRQNYSQLVSEGILTKKRMKAYFASLPGKSSVNMTSFTNDLKEYATVALRSTTPIEPGTANMKPVEAKDIDIALSELLPVVAREAYFTAALFGLSAKHLSGREKKRNFEAAKKSVDFSTHFFKYYMSRICGIASEADAEGKKVDADPMLSLVASILLNEAMDSYIDRQKKGGDHSLSLAYVRATILDLRKKVDKQWVAWVEDQIKWIQSNPNVPTTGKRAGIFVSFSRFPSYLDHVMTCIRAGRPSDQVPNLSKIKVVAYYLQKMAGALFNSLHECSERETTDQQYAANVMRMENSYFFTQTIKQRGPELTELFQKQITAASSICKQSTDAYLGFMIKREFKPLHTLFANISRVRREVGDADVPIHVPRATFEKTLSKECSREILKEKIGSIYYRLEKHLSETGGLLPVAWKALVKVLYEWVGRWEKLSKQCYNFTLEPSASDVVRIAKQAAGLSAKKISDEKKRNAHN